MTAIKMIIRPKQLSWNRSGKFSQSADSKVAGSEFCVDDFSIFSMILQKMRSKNNIEIRGKYEVLQQIVVLTFIAGMPYQRLHHHSVFLIGGNRPAQ
jgi:hypothetical protein